MTRLLIKGVDEMHYEVCAFLEVSGSYDLRAALAAAGFRIYEYNLLTQEYIRIVDPQIVLLPDGPYWVFKCLYSGAAHPGPEVLKKIEGHQRVLKYTFTYWRE